MRVAPLLPLLAVLLAAPAVADSLDDAAIHAEPQYYLMSLPPAPVQEIADAVLGEALGLPFKVDEDVDAQMAFRIDGMYAPRALAREFGYRLWNVDVALVERPSNGLWLIPRAELAVAQAQGATLVAPVAGMTPPRPTASVPRPAVRTPAKPEAPSPDWSWLAWLGGGWIGGAVTVVGWSWLRRRRVRQAGPAAVLALPAPEIVAAEPGPDDLVIPNFAPRRQAAA